MRAPRSPLILMLGVLACAAAATPPDPVLPPAATAYAQRMATLPPAPGPVAVESLFTLALAAANELTLPPDLNAHDLSPVEAMDDSAAERARRILPGLIIIRSDEGSGAAPDDSFFLQLAHRRGTPSDTAFFRLRTVTGDAYGGYSWTQMVTDYSGCTSFGSGDLVRAWKAWSGYQRRYPTHYLRTVRETLEEIESELLQGDCVCGGKDDLLRELQMFVDELPRDTLVSRVKSRREAVRRGDVRIRYNCEPR